MEGDYQEQDRRFAEWYVWAKREVGSDSRVCLGAAQAAIEALQEGSDEQAARQAARGSVAGHGIALLGRIPPRRRAYAEWYDWARREIGGSREGLHAAAAVALERLDTGGDADQAAAAARASGSTPPAPTPGPAQPGPPLPGPPQPGTSMPQLTSAPGASMSAPAPYSPPASFGVAPPVVQPAPYPVHPQFAVQPLPPQAPSHVYAGFWRRAAAWLIDTVLLTIGLAVLWFFISLFALFGLRSSGQDITDSNLTGVQLAVLLIALVLAWLYYAGLESSAWLGTVGKRLMGLVVTDLYGRRLGFGRATGRYFGKVVSAMALFVGYLMAAFTERKQGLHDLMAGTIVVRQQYLTLITAPPRPSEPHGQASGAGEVQQGA